MDLQTLENTVLSWGSIGKSAPVLAAITIRKSQALIKTSNRRDTISRAEDIILNAIRSKANIDGKNARVAYEVLAAMTGFSKRHVIRRSIR